MDQARVRLPFLGIAKDDVMSTFAPLHERTCGLPASLPEQYTVETYGLLIKKVATIRWTVEMSVLTFLDAHGDPLGKIVVTLPLHAHASAPARTNVFYPNKALSMSTAHLYAVALFLAAWGTKPLPFACKPRLPLAAVVWANRKYARLAVCSGTDGGAFSGNDSVDYLVSKGMQDVPSLEHDVHTALTNFRFELKCARLDASALLAIVKRLHSRVNTPSYLEQELKDLMPDQDRSDYIVDSLVDFIKESKLSLLQILRFRHSVFAKLSPSLVCLYP
jgi:hypothetical protein